MSNVVKFGSKQEQPKQPGIWTCVHCECASFRLYSDQTIECAGCNHRVPDGEGWVTLLPPAPEEMPVIESIGNDTKCWGSAELALAMVHRDISKFIDDKNIAMLAGWDSNGRMRSWNNAVTRADLDERIEWIEHYLEGMRANKLVDS